MTAKLQIKPKVASAMATFFLACSLFSTLVIIFVVAPPFFSGFLTSPLQLVDTGAVVATVCTGYWVLLDFTLEPFNRKTQIGGVAVHG